MTFTKLKTDKYRVDIQEIIEKCLVIYNEKYKGATQVKISLNDLPSALIKFLKQVDYLETHLHGVFKQSFNILALGDLNYKEENKTLFSKFKKDLNEFFYSLAEDNGNVTKYPAANEMQYILNTNENQEKNIRSKRFMPELEKLFIKLFDKLDLIYGVPFLSKKITINKDEDTIFSLKVDFLADRFHIRANIDSDCFDNEAIKNFNEKLSFFEKNINKIYEKANLESHFRTLATSDFLPELGEKERYSRNGFSTCLEKMLIDFLIVKHPAFECKSELEIVSFSIDHEKSIEAQLTTTEHNSYLCPKKIILGYGNFTSKHIVDLIAKIRNKNFKNSIDMSSDLTRVLSISKPH